LRMDAFSNCDCEALDRLVNAAALGPMLTRWPTAEAAILPMQGLFSRPMRRELCVEIRLWDGQREAQCQRKDAPVCREIEKIKRRY
jgi:hypothetical protein